MPLTHRPFAVAACLSLLLAGNAGAQRAFPVADLNPTLSENPGSFAHGFISVGAHALFAVRERPADLVPRLWSTDGSAVGTRPLGLQAVGEELRGATVGGTRLWIDSQAPDFGSALWRSDGTSEGTGRLTSEEVSVVPNSLAADAEVAYFTSSRLDSPPGSEVSIPLFTLWRSDGTVAGTRPVRDLIGLYPGIPAVVLRGVLYFQVAPIDPETGSPLAQRSLWRSDGTSEGTREVLRLGAHPMVFPTVAGDRLFFLTPAEGASPTRQHLWSSDGTPAGTRVLARFPLSDSHFVQLSAVNDRLYARTADALELWTSDGSPEGTRRLLRLPAGEQSFIGTLDGASFGAVFPVADAAHGLRLFKTDGTHRGTETFAQLSPTYPRGKPILVGHPARAGNRLLLPIQTTAQGVELWASDGTAEGTGPLVELCPGPCDGVVSPLSALPDGRVLFAGRDPAHGTELWRSAARPGTTRRLSDLATDAPFAAGAGKPLRAVMVGDDIVFAADDGIHGDEPWVFTSELGGASLLTDLATPAPGPSNPVGWTEYQGAALFVACDGQAMRLYRSTGEGAPESLADLGISCDAFASSYEAEQNGGAPPLFAVVGELAYLNLGPLWRTDGTPAGTFPLIPGVGAPYDPFTFSNPVPFGGGAAFWRLEGNFPPAGLRYGLWTTDGTREGTVALEAFPTPFAVTAMTSIGSLLYFLAEDYSHGSGFVREWEAWRSDGTAAGTFPLTSEFAFALATPIDASFVEAGGEVYFRLVASGSRQHLWKTDGTREGTIRLDSTRGFADDFALSPLALTSYRGELAFLDGGDSLATTTLWITDGTSAGSRRVRELGPRGSLSRMIVLDDRLYFQKGDSDPNEQIWTSDGTTAGTRAIPASGGVLLEAFRRSGLVAGEGQIFLTGTSPTTGTELWRLETSSLEATLVQDIAPGETTSGIREAVVANGHLFISADDGVIGREPWSLPLAPEEPTCRESSSTLCLEDRFRLAVRWRDEQGVPRAALPHALGERAAAFTFANASRPELVIKLLDGSAINGHHWIFGGGLTQQGYEIDLLDTETGIARRYLNRSRQLLSFADTAAFAETPFSTVLLGETAGFLAHTAPKALPSIFEPRDVCAPPSQLCLLGGRFVVTVRQSDGTLANASGFSDGAGWFWRARADNPEVVIKLIDARALDQGFWLFASFLSSQALSLTLSDLTAFTTYNYTSSAISTLEDRLPP